MSQSFSESYKAAGVDVTAGYKSVELMKKHVARTMIPGVLSGIGGFGGLFEPDLKGYDKPVFVSGTDGVGTKLKLAIELDINDTVGIDCVAMCVNDIVCAGAKPLVFLDYIAMGKNIPERTADIVKGVADGCVQAGCALIGGETAEMPGFYPEKDYDLAGFSFGVVDKKNIIDGSKVQNGDILIGLASSGIHSNGFSLVRHIFDIESNIVTKYYEALGETLGEALLKPTKIYVKPVLDLISNIDVHAISHITGGGFYENIPRMFSDDFGAVISRKAIEAPPIFEVIQKAGNIPERDMYNTFNMGMGMCIAVSQEDADRAVEMLNAAGEKAFIAGEIVQRTKGVIIE
ncbi:MAG: phosphoribosylformylglycinamidine cyclo-ligase [Clostridia bacterium]|nr:phosphoribosylformylglycinamidine cyclo-ligase [Clostridia bacterium]